MENINNSSIRKEVNVLEIENLKFNTVCFTETMDQIYSSISIQERIKRNLRTMKDIYCSEYSQKPMLKKIRGIYERIGIQPYQYDQVYKKINQLNDIKNDYEKKKQQIFRYVSNKDLGE